MMIATEERSVPPREKYTECYEACRALSPGAVVSFRLDGEEEEVTRLYHSLLKWKERGERSHLRIAKRGGAIYVERVG